MSISINNAIVIGQIMSDNTTTVTLSSNLAIYTIDDLYNKLQEALDFGNIVEIDAEDVEKVDAASLQVIITFINRLKETNQKWVWKNPSAEFQTYCKLLGIQDHLQMSIADNI